MTSPPPDGTAATTDDISRAELLPFLLSFSDLRKRAYLWPGVTTAVFVAVLLALAALNNESTFLCVMATYVSLANLYLVYLACGRKQPFLYVLLITAFAFASTRCCCR